MIELAEVLEREIDELVLYQTRCDMLEDILVTFYGWIVL